MMKSYQFSVTATGIDPSSLEFERVCELGDTRIALANGQIIVDFTRSGYSLATAIESAVAEMRATGLTIVGIKQSHCRDNDLTQA